MSYVTWKRTGEIIPHVLCVWVAKLPKNPQPESSEQHPQRRVVTAQAGYHDGKKACCLIWNQWNGAFSSSHYQRYLWKCWPGPKNPHFFFFFYIFSPPNMIHDTGLCRCSTVTDKFKGNFTSKFYTLFPVEYEIFSYQLRCSQHCMEQKQEKDHKMVNW